VRKLSGNPYSTRATAGRRRSAATIRNESGTASSVTSANLPSGAGASGFVLKEAPADDLIRAALAVAAGNSWLDPAVTARVLAAYRASPQAPGGRAQALAALTGRELDVLRLSGRGASNQEIAERLVISEATVKSHVGNILSKLTLRDRAAAIVLAFDQGLVQPEE
jgi:DNA-binding NarL/FixJ family response regulator